MLEAGPNPCPGSEMNDLIKRHAAQHFIELGALGDIRMYKGKRLGARLEFSQGVLFDGRIVKIVQVIQGTYRVAVIQQAFADMRADESHSAGNQNIHGVRLTGSRSAVENADNA